MKPVFLLLIFVSSVACAQDRTDVKYYCTPCNQACDTTSYSKPGACGHCGMSLIARNDAAVQEIKAATKQKLNVAIFIHEGVELLDFAGPGEVFASAGFNVFTVAATESAIVSQGFVKIIPQYSIKNCPKPDVIVLPGGATGIPMGNKDVIDWIIRAVPNTILTMSVCTGAGLLSKAGLLNGKTVTTFHNYIDELQRITPQAKVIRNARFVDNGTIITTAGVSAGIDGALHAVYKLKGKATAQQTAEYMEYDKWKPEEGLIVKGN